jgi:hypothetical protein
MRPHLPRHSSEGWNPSGLGSCSALIELGLDTSLRWGDGGER